MEEQRSRMVYVGVAAVLVAAIVAGVMVRRSTERAAVAPSPSLAPLAGGAPDGSMPPPPARGPESPAAREFAKRHNLDDRTWMYLREQNDAWLAALEKTRTEGESPSLPLDNLATQREFVLEQMLKGKDAAKDFHAFEAALPGAAVRVAARSGKIYEGKSFK